jgi:hypothetical protein
MMDLALHAVTDRAQPVVQPVVGALTGKGSGLLQTATQNQGSAQAQMQQASEVPGQAMTIGQGAFWGAGSGAGSPTLDSPAGADAAAPSAAGAGQAATGQSAGALTLAATSGASRLGAGGPTGASGMAAAPVSELVRGAFAQTASAGASSATGAGSSLTSVVPGMQAATPLFTALPTIPSMPRLQDVLGRLGSLAGTAVGAATTPSGSTASSGGDAIMAPVNQFAGSIRNNTPEATAEL